MTHPSNQNKGKHFVNLSHMVDVLTLDKCHSSLATCRICHPINGSKMFFIQDLVHNWRIHKCTPVRLRSNTDSGIYTISDEHFKMSKCAEIDCFQSGSKKLPLSV